jgi:hypothetical protein
MQHRPYAFPQRLSSLKLRISNLRGSEFTGLCKRPNSDKLKGHNLPNLSSCNGVAFWAEDRWEKWKARFVPHTNLSSWRKNKSQQSTQHQPVLQVSRWDTGLWPGLLFSSSYFLLTTQVHEDFKRLAFGVIPLPLSLIPKMYLFLVSRYNSQVMVTWI